MLSARASTASTAWPRRCPSACGGRTRSRGSCTRTVAPGSSSTWIRTTRRTGTFTGHVGVTIDVTDLTRAQHELARHRDHLGELVAERTVELERSYEALR